MSHVTVRGLAAAAGVNIAAVNYHFGSKEALLEAARVATIQATLQDTDACLERWTDDPQSALEELFTYYLEGSFRYPQLTRAHLYEPFADGDFSGPFPQLFAPVLDRLRHILCTVVADLDEVAASRRVMAAISAILFPACFHALFPSLGALDSEAKRHTYAQEIVKQALAPL